MNIFEIPIDKCPLRLLCRVQLRDFMMNYLKSLMANKGNLCELNQSLCHPIHLIRYKSSHNCVVMSKLLRQLDGKYKVFSPKRHKSEVI